LEIDQISSKAAKQKAWHPYMQGLGLPAPDARHLSSYIFLLQRYLGPFDISDGILCSSYLFQSSPLSLQRFVLSEMYEQVYG
jgi:hypothetical protein